MIHISELNPLWTEMKILPLIRGTARAALADLPGFAVWDSCLLVHELVREMCLASKCQRVDKVHKDNWNCNNRNHPGKYVLEHWAKQLLNHVLYNHMQA